MKRINRSAPIKPPTTIPAPRRVTGEYQDVFIYIESIVGRMLYDYEACAICALIKSEQDK